MATSLENWCESQSPNPVDRRCRNRQGRKVTEDRPQVIEVKQEVEDMALEGEETWVSSDKHEVLEPMVLSVEPENSGRKTNELPIKAQELKERPAMERDMKVIHGTPFHPGERETRKRTSCSVEKCGRREGESAPTNIDFRSLS